MRFLAAALLLTVICHFPAAAQPVIGVYGVPPVSRHDPGGYIGELEAAGVGAVFVPPDKATIAWFKARGLKVYLSVDVFGGTQAWETHPDAVPVCADGRRLSEVTGEDEKVPGGVCPTHPGWRRDRLDRIAALAGRFRGDSGIDGIWLDHLRYPGLWEAAVPRIPDTCYCPRCLEKFRAQSRVDMPTGMGPREAARWIHDHCRYEWMTWKKEQIASFAAEVRGILDAGPEPRPLELGLFLVPWTKGERGNAVSYHLAQDAARLSTVADVLSPMAYHRMCARPEAWVGRITDYFKQAADCRVWPVVQAMDGDPEELARVLSAAGLQGGDGVLVYAFKHLQPGHYQALTAFRKPDNLIRNPEFEMAPGGDGPIDWQRAAGADAKVKKSSLDVWPPERIDVGGWKPLAGRTAMSLGITAENDRGGVWSSPLPACVPGEDFLFTGLFYRYDMENGVYPAVSLWGKEFVLDTHLQVRRFQPVRVHVECPAAPSENGFRFINHHPGHTFWMSDPRLTTDQAVPDPDAPKPAAHFFQKGFFPIGVYGADAGQLETIAALGINTVFTGGQKGVIDKCRELGLKAIVGVPRDPDRLPPFLDGLADAVAARDLAFYVNDEPGIHAFPRHRASDIHRLIKERFPDAATGMAVVRPQVCRDYTDGADFFMLDPYPVPSMPMTWLSDSMGRAAADVGQARLAAVVQAFGGEKWARHGWPRMPTRPEIDCLAFLSVVNGARGVFFFTWSAAGATREGREDLGAVVGRLNRLYDWLGEENSEPAPAVKMTSPYGLDPKGRPAIQSCLRKKGSASLVIAVNTIGTFVEGTIGLADSPPAVCREVFSGEVYPTVEGKLWVRLEPYETKAFLF